MTAHGKRFRRILPRCALLFAIAVTVACCDSGPTETEVGETELWRLELEQLDDGTPAIYPRRGTINMLLRLNRTRQPDPTCADTENPDVTTFLADVEARSSRLQQATPGTADGSWNCHGFRATVRLNDGTRYELVSDSTMEAFGCLRRDADCPAGRVQQVEVETSMLPYRWTAGTRSGHFFFARDENFAWEPIHDTFVDVLIQNARDEPAEFHSNIYGFNHHGLEIRKRPGVPEIGANSSVRVSWMAHSARSRLRPLSPSNPRVPEGQTITIRWNRAPHPFDRRAKLTCFLGPNHPRTVQFLIHEDGTLECGTGWVGSVLLDVSRKPLFIEAGFHQVSDTLTLITGNADSLLVESSHPTVRPVLLDYDPPLPRRRELLTIVVEREAPRAEHHLTISIRNDDTGEFHWISVPVYVYELDIEVDPRTVTVPVGQSATAEVSIERTAVFSDVRLSMPDPPTGVVPSFSPSIPNVTSTLTLDLGTAVQPEPGTYDLTVCATIVRDPSKTCHAGTAITLVVPEPLAASYELSITKESSNDGSVPIGEPVFFDLAVKHDGTSGAFGIEVTDLLPDGFTFDKVESINKGTYDAGTGLWNIGTLPPNTTATLQIRAIAAGEGTWTNAATITAGLAPGDDPDNNEASVTITVVKNEGAIDCTNPMPPTAGTIMLENLQGNPLTPPLAPDTRFVAKPDDFVDNVGGGLSYAWDPSYDGSTPNLTVSGLFVEITAGLPGTYGIYVRAADACHAAQDRPTDYDGTASTFITYEVQ